MATHANCQSIDDIKNQSISPELSRDVVVHLIRVLTDPSLSHVRKVKTIFHHLIDIHVEHGYKEEVEQSPFKQLELGLFDD